MSSLTTNRFKSTNIYGSLTTLDNPGILGIGAIPASFDLSGNGAQCVNMKDLGTCNGSVPEGRHLQMNFTVAPYAGQNSLCAKYKWATGCGITWDGITSGVSNPCDTSGNTA